MATTDRRRLLIWQNRFKMATFVLVLLLGIFSLFWVKDLLLSFVVAVIISYLLSPWISQLESWGVNRILATTLVFLSFFAITGLLFWAASPFLSAQISSLQEDLPLYIESTQRFVHALQDRVQSTIPGSFELTFDQSIPEIIKRGSGDVLSRLPEFASSSASVLILSPFIAFFLLRDGRDITRSLLAIIPNSVFEIAVNLIHQINTQIGQYFRARLLESGIIALIVWLGLLFLDFKYEFVLALFAGVTNLIPYIGPIVGFVPAAVIALTTNDPQLTLLLVLAVYGIAQLIDIFFIVPVVVAKIVDLHPVTVVLAVIVGAQLLGVLGMLISIPIFSALKVTIVAIYTHVTDFG